MKAISMLTDKLRKTMRRQPVKGFKPKQPEDCICDCDVDGECCGN